MEITNYRIGKGFLKASFTLKMPKMKMEFRDCSWFEKDGNRWFSFPSKPYEKDGQKKFFQMVAFENPEIKSSFETAFFLVLEKFLKDNPQFDETKPTVQQEMNYDEVPF